MKTNKIMKPYNCVCGAEVYVSVSCLGVLIKCPNGCYQYRNESMDEEVAVKDWNSQISKIKLCKDLPIKKNKITMYINFQQIESSVLSEAQIKLINEPTPAEVIEVNTDENNRQYKSVSGHYVKQRLNAIFGYSYNFQILEREYCKETSEVFVLGRLTIKTNGVEIIREQFGRHYLTTIMPKGKAKQIVDVGNGYKAAATDALKKCASELGICWDIYQKQAHEAEPEPQSQEDADTIKETERLKKYLATQHTSAAVEQTITHFLATVPDPTPAQLKIIEEARAKFEVKKPRRGR